MDTRRTALVAVEGFGATRDEAMYNALRFALRDGLRPFMGACAKDEILEARIRERLDGTRKQGYRDLVKSETFSRDRVHKGAIALFPAVYAANR